MTDEYLRGSTEMCPKCGSRDVFVAADYRYEGYGPGIATCQECRALWEPFDPAQIWDRTDPHCSFRQPCNNCAFRKGSPEQADPYGWDRLKHSLSNGAEFHCHKGVPIEAGAQHGFAYPQGEDGMPDRSKLRLCRGFLNSKLWMGARDE